MAVKLALDTNAYVEMARGNHLIQKAVCEADTVALTFISLAELRSGFRGGLKEAENERALQRFLNQPGIETIFPDEQTVHHYAVLYNQLRKQGTPIPTNDLWIAALVREHDLVLLSFDNHFKHLGQLPRLKI